jgi:hypothetical protein
VAPMLILSRRSMAKLRVLQSGVLKLAADRNKVLRMFMASRYATMPLAQRELWLEFSWADQEYRSAVHELAKFCQAARRAAPGAAASPENPG